MNKYSYQAYDDEKMVGAISRNLGISTKQSVEISSYLKGKTTDRAITILEDAIAMKRAIPFTRFTEGAGHKPGPLASGKFAVSASKAILSLIKTAIANAENKGLGTPLQIVHMLANNAGNRPRYGRQRGRSSKNTHIEVVLAETKDAVKEKKITKPKAKPAVKKVEAKTEKSVSETNVSNDVKKPKISKTPKTDSPKATEEKSETKEAKKE